MKKKKSITVNAFFNMLNTFLTMAFSLLTYPYVTRVLQVENLGRVNYSASIVSYFSLIAALGFQSYAIREGSGKKNSKELQEFSNQIFSLNAISVIVTYVLLVVCLVIIPDLKQYTALIVIQSILIINNWLGVNWINIIFEDYVSITIRSITAQLIALFLLFIFVKDPQDYYIYAGLSVGANFVISLVNYLYIRKKYCAISFTKRLNFRKHMKPVFIFFSNTIAVSIYANSDVTMIGLFLGNVEVGLYSVAVKIYTTIRSVVAAAYTVAIPRMSFYATHGDMESMKKLLNRIISTIIFVSIPGITLLFYLSEDLVVFLSGIEYSNAGKPLSILAVGIVFALMGGCLAYCLATPLKKEKSVLKATVISAIENVMFNFFMIPKLGISGAAITTVLSECTVCLCIFFSMRKYWSLFEWKYIVEVTVKSLFSVIPACCMFMIQAQYVMNNRLVFMILYSLILLISYFICCMLLKNPMMKEIKSLLKEMTED